jgi:hypothetical protein
MLNRSVLILLVAGAVLATDARTVFAQQTVNFTVGLFTVRGEDARVDDDVLVLDSEVLAFDFKDFNGAAIGAEWLVPLGSYLEAGAGLSFYRRTVPTVYSDFTQADDSEIEQDLRLRVIPVAFTVRVLPLGQTSAVQPYFGGGLGVLAWRYSETGDFVDFSRNLLIVPDRFAASGTATGPIALGGIRFAADTFSAGFEARYQGGAADLDELPPTLAGLPGSPSQPRLDLGGWTYQATVGIRFGR